MRQEQERAQPDIVEVAKGVLRMQLPIEVPGLGHVNMYCFPDEHGAAVMDPGLPGDASWDIICERLRQADLRVRDIHTVVVTHSHADHYGGASRFHAESGCRVIAHQQFSVFGEAFYEPHAEVSVEHLDAGPEPVPEGVGGDEVIPRWLRSSEGQEVRTPWGGRMPAPTQEQRWLWERGRADSSKAVVPQLTHTVRHGSRIRLSGRDWRVWHTPGHTNDHICLYDPDEGTFVSGDHVLPSITPHISGMGKLADPLEHFFASLDRVLEVGAVAGCLPAHGHPFTDLEQRVEAIKRHHRERLEKIKDIGRRLGTATVQQFSEELFRQRSWGYMAESEAYAHLEHLRLARQIERQQTEDGLLVYTV